MRGLPPNGFGTSNCILAPWGAQFIFENLTILVFQSVFKKYLGTYPPWFFQNIICLITRDSSHMVQNDVEMTGIFSDFFNKIWMVPLTILMPCIFYINFYIT